MNILPYLYRLVSGCLSTRHAQHGNYTHQAEHVGLVESRFDCIDLQIHLSREFVQSWHGVRCEENTAGEQAEDSSAGAPVKEK